MDKLEWTALEYEEKERNSDWFWALGIIVVTSSLTAIIYKNYFFAVLLILSGVLLGFFAKKKPDVVSYEINAKGLRIRSRLYPFTNIKSFWIQESHPEDAKSKDILFIESERVFMPILAIPIDDTLGENIKFIMLDQNIPEKPMKEHVSEKIMESLGF